MKKRLLKMNSRPKCVYLSLKSKGKKKGKNVAMNGHPSWKTCNGEFVKSRELIT